MDTGNPQQEDSFELHKIQERERQKKKIKRRSYILLFFGLGTIIATTVGMILAVPSLAKLDAAKGLSRAQDKMSNIGKYLVLYAVRNDSRLPEKLSEIYGKAYLPSLEYFDSTDLPGKVKSKEDIDKGIDFIYIYSKENPNLTEKAIPVLRENKKDGAIMLLSRKGITWKYPDKETSDLKDGKEKNTEQQPDN
jgi:hypothetical protein